MSKSAMVRARVEPVLKEQAETIFQNLGINATQAITMFYKQVEIKKGLPFSLNIPNKTTLKTFESTDKNENLIKSKNAKDMFSKLGI